MLLQDSQCQSDQFHDRRDLSFYAIPGNVYRGKYLIKPSTCCVFSQPHYKWEKKQMKRMGKDERASLAVRRSVLHTGQLTLKEQLIPGGMVMGITRYS